MNGDLIYILQNAEDQGNELASQNTPGSSTDTLYGNQQLPRHSVEDPRDPTQVQ